MRSEYRAKNGSWIEIARVGTFKDSKGISHNFSRERLFGVIAKYDPSRRDAPLVIGHPAVNGPAFGWVRRLKMSGDKLLAYVACVTDEVKQAVDNGLYRYVSMSLYPDDGLRHVGLLGGTPPAIDGLAPVSFSDVAALTIDFNDDGLLEQKGERMDLEELKRQIAELEAKLAAALQEKDAAAKESATLKEELTKKDSEAEKAAAVAERTAAEFAAFRDQKEKELISGRIAQLVADGRVTPAEKPAVEKVAETLRQGARNFSSGGDENPLETYLGSLEQRSVSGLMSNFNAPTGGETEDQPSHKPLSAGL